MSSTAESTAQPSCSAPGCSFPVYDWHEDWFCVSCYGLWLKESQRTGRLDRAAHPAGGVRARGNGLRSLPTVTASLRPVDQATEVAALAELPMEPKALVAIIGAR
jgi:hypothetical protein